MRKLSAALAVVLMFSAMHGAMARGGRTTAADCEAGSDDPDCPDTDSSGKAKSSDHGNGSRK